MSAQALSHPFLLLLACALLFEVAARLLRRFRHRVPDADHALRLAPVLIVLFVVIVGSYVALPVYVDHVEPSVTSVSWAVVQGQPAYPDPEGSAMYGLPYGPMLFLANGVTMQLLGPSLASSKVAGCVAAVGSVLLLAIALRGAPVPSRSVGLALMALLCLTFGVASFWARAEPMLVFCAAASVLSLTVAAVPAVIIAGTALGLATSLKVSAAIYLIPTLALQWRKHGVWAMAGIAAIAAVVIAAPFVVSGRFSASTYVYWLSSAVSEGVRVQNIPKSLEWAALLSVPLFMAAAEDRRERERDGMTLFHGMLVASMLVSLPLAIKHGTGHYHFLPFVPSVVYAGRLVKWQMIRPAAMMATCVMLAAASLSAWVPSVTTLPGRQIVEELRRLERTQTGTVAMGYSARYRLSFFRPVLVFDGNPYVLDSASVMDWHFRGRPFPAAMIDGLRRCEIQTWILPAGAPPFQLSNAYPAGGDIFPEEFRQAFEENYVRDTGGQWFDIWRCRPR